MRMKLALASVLLFLSPALAVTLYSPPLDASPNTGAYVWCEAVNVTASPQTITVSVVDGCGGHTEASYTCTTTPDNPGCATYFAPDDSAFYFCRFESSASNKSALRTVGKVRKVDPATGGYAVSEQAVAGE